MMRRMDAEPEEFELVDWLQAEVHRMVAEILEHEDLVRQLDALLPTDNRGFDEALAARELALIADGVPRAEIAFRLAVVRATREALLAQTAIRALPTAMGRPRPRRRTFWSTAPRTGERWRSPFGMTSRVSRAGR